MHEFIAWCGFVGAWLLVAGPIYQAAIELDDQEIEREAIHRTSESVPRPTRVSPWWWLLPPVGYWLNMRRSRDHRQAIFAAMKPEHVAQFIHFSEKATGWIFVAGGAFFIAIKETWELLEAYEAPEWLVGPIVVVMVVLAAANTVVRVRWSHRMLDQPGGRSSADPAL